MDLSHLLSSGKLDTTLLCKLGFQTHGQALQARYDIPGCDLYSIYSYQDDRLEVAVYDTFDDEPYAMFEDETSSGKFVTGIRYSVVHFAEAFIEKAKCNVYSMKDNTIRIFSEKHGITYDNPWPNDPKYQDNLVFRETSGKWVGLIMTIPINRLGLSGEQLVDCINLKHRTDDIANVIDGKTVFPAYHMNKKHWITVLLGENTDRNLLEALIDESISLVKAN